jgi:hypothetical protein
LTTKAEKKHLSAVAELGCLICNRMGYPNSPSEIHHKRTGTGAGKKASHWDSFPLCVSHHRGNMGIHGMGTKAFVKYYEVTEDELIDEVYRLLGYSRGGV